MEFTRSENPLDIIKGLIIGIGIPLMGYYLIQGFFAALISAGIMDETSMGIATRRFRTMSLVAICCNIVPLHFLRKNRSFNLIRGLVMATIILGGIWVYYFRASLYQ